MFELCYDNAEVKSWLMARTPDPQRRGFDANPDYPITCFGYKIDDQIALGLAFYNYVPWYRGIEVAIALELPDGNNGALLRGMIKNAMLYPFEKLQCQRVTAMVPKRADKSRKLVKTIGFQEEGKIRHGFLIDDCILYGLTKRDAEAKWKYREG